MTHNELLDKIYWHWRKDNRGDGLQPMIDYRTAFLAIVELHKPVEMPYARVEGTLTCNYCSGLCHSRSGLSCDDCPPLYPCATIQVIERELK